jgi:hypothetical protein
MYSYQYSSHLPLSISSSSSATQFPQLNLNVLTLNKVSIPIILPCYYDKSSAASPSNNVLQQSNTPLKSLNYLTIRDIKRELPFQSGSIDIFYNNSIQADSSTLAQAGINPNCTVILLYNKARFKLYLSASGAGNTTLYSSELLRYLNSNRHYMQLSAKAKQTFSSLLAGAERRNIRLSSTDCLEIISALKAEDSRPISTSLSLGSHREKYLDELDSLLRGRPAAAAAAPSGAERDQTLSTRTSVMAENRERLAELQGRLVQFESMRRAEKQRIKRKPSSASSNSAGASIANYGQASPVPSSNNAIISSVEASESSEAAGESQQRLENLLREEREREANRLKFRRRGLESSTNLSGPAHTEEFFLQSLAEEPAAAALPSLSEAKQHEEGKNSLSAGDSRSSSGSSADNGAEIARLYLLSAVNECNIQLIKILRDNSAIFKSSAHSKLTVDAARLQDELDSVKRASNVAAAAGVAHVTELNKRMDTAKTQLYQLTIQVSAISNTEKTTNVNQSYAEASVAPHNNSSSGSSTRNNINVTSNPTSSSSSASAFPASQSELSQLINTDRLHTLSMLGFGENACRRALLLEDNDIQRASNYLLENSHAMDTLNSVISKLELEELISRRALFHSGIVRMRLARPLSRSTNHNSTDSESNNNIHDLSSSPSVELFQPMQLDATAAASNL